MDRFQGGQGGFPIGAFEIRGRAAPGRIQFEEMFNTVEPRLQTLKVFFSRDAIVLNEEFHHGIETDGFAFFAHHAVLLARKVLSHAVHGRRKQLVEITYKISKVKHSAAHK